VFVSRSRKRQMDFGKVWRVSDYVSFCLLIARLCIFLTMFCKETMVDLYALWNTNHSLFCNSSPLAIPNISIFRRRWMWNTSQIGARFLHLARQGGDSHPCHPSVMPLIGWATTSFDRVTHNNPYDSANAGRSQRALSISTQ